MNLRKKITVSALVLSMTASSLSVLPAAVTSPVSGFVGPKSVYAAPADSFIQPLLVQLNALHAALLAGDPADVQDVRKLRSEIAALDPASNLALTDPVWSKIAAKLPPSFDKEALRLKVFELFKAIFTLQYDPQASDLLAIYSDPGYRAALHTIAVAGGDSNITFGDLFIFLFEVQETTRELVGGLSQGQLLQLAASREKRNELALEGLNIVLEKDESFSAILNNLGITAQDIRSTVLNFQLKLKTYRPASGAIAVAALRLSAKETVKITGGGRIHHYGLTVRGVTVPSFALTWSKVSGSADVSVSPNGKVSIPNGVPSASAVIQAKLTNPFGGNDKVIFEEEVTLTAEKGGPKK
ncbi:hypothetical protein [Paenibacillus beijingensis]|uniref:Uncharacterized protein n=1 Tax=Paenibacillus beijingensis TaxID=1126833 RepID=A0A0D5NLC6_9BACL|nr:hypothetical protein [Paenibacillus beijingensis]AJY75718.1 hypothetical protein VN24_15615 [Paenibacillus beijingensis]